MEKSQANEWIHRLLPVLESALGYEVALPLRPGASIEQMLRACPDLQYWLDATERQIQRPKDADRQKSHYSGKKKSHTIKNTVVADSKRRIVFLGETVEGKRHDKQLVEDDDPPFPEKSSAGADSGYEGYHPPGVTITTPMTIKRCWCPWACITTVVSIVLRRHFNRRHKLAGENARIRLEEVKPNFRACLLLLERE